MCIVHGDSVYAHEIEMDGSCAHRCSRHRVMCGSAIRVVMSLGPNDVMSPCYGRRLSSAAIGMHSPLAGGSRSIKSQERRKIKNDVSLYIIGVYPGFMIGGPGPGASLTMLMQLSYNLRIVVLGLFSYFKLA